MQYLFRFIQLIIVSLCCLITSVGHAAMCPNVNSFIQDSHGRWSIAALPEAPKGSTGWGLFSQGPEAMDFHQLNTFNVTLDKGEPSVVNCAYGYRDNQGVTHYLVEIALNISSHEIIKPTAGMAFHPGSLNLSTCDADNLSQCQFDIISKS